MPSKPLRDRGWDTIRRGDRSYVRFRKTIDGRTHELIGPSRAALQKRADELIRRASRHLVTDDEDITLAAWAERWLEAKETELGHAGARTLANYRSVLAKHVNPALGAVRLRDLRAEHRRRLQRSLVARGLKASTINRIDAVLQSILQAADNEDLPVVGSAIRAVRPVRGRPEKKQTLSTEQVRAILAVARGQALEDHAPATTDAAAPPPGHQEAVAGIPGGDRRRVDEGVVPPLVGPLRPGEVVGLADQVAGQDRRLVAEDAAQDPGLPVVAQRVEGVQPGPDGAAVARHQDHLLAGADESPATTASGAPALEPLRVVAPNQRETPRVRVADRQPVPVDHDRSWYAMWVCYVFTGARDAEVRALRWSDWDQEAGTLTIRRQLPQQPGDPPRWQEWLKGRKIERVVPVVEPLAVVLRAHKAAQNAQRLSLGRGMWSDYGLIFPDEVGRALRAQRVGDQFHAACEAAGIAVWKGLGVHALRHAANGVLREAGADTPLRAQILGHTQAVNELVYTADSLALARDALARMAAALG